MNSMVHNQKIFFVCLVGLLGQICAGLNYNRIDSAFDNRYNTTDPYNPALLYAFGERQAVFYQIALNVTDATVVDLSKITVTYYNYIINENTLNTKVQGSAVTSIGRVLDPCVFPSPPSDAVLTFNGTTDAKEGHITSVIGARKFTELKQSATETIAAIRKRFDIETIYESNCGHLVGVSISDCFMNSFFRPDMTPLTVEVPFVQNATPFEYTNPAILSIGDAGTDAFVGSRFFMMDFNVSEGESWGLEATSTEDISLSVAGFGNCPSFIFTNNSIYWTGQLSGNQTVNTPVVAVKDKSFVWLQVTSQKSATVTLTWKQLPSTPATPGNEPVNGPSSTPNDKLPQWAMALLIVFGLVIGVLIVIVIVLCVKNRRRATYQGV